MKSQVAPYQTAAWCVRIATVSGLTLRLTTYPFNLTMSNATVYESDSGYEQTAYSSGTSMAASAIDLEGFVGVAGITRDQIASGVFDNARVSIFKCNFLAPVEDYEPITTGLFGKTLLEDDRYKIEGMALIDALNQSVGRVVTASCAHSLGSPGCGISIASIEVSGTITGITSGTVFMDSARTEMADWFGAGKIRFTSGLNAGLPAAEVKSYGADGTVTLFESLYYPPQIGDAYILTPGCRRRLADCRDKWNNVVNPVAGGFGGFPDLPVASVAAQVGPK